MFPAPLRGACFMFADTGGEKPETYDFIDKMRTWTVRNMDLGIVALANDGMYGTLENECLTKNTLPSLVFGWRSCSDKYKMRPQKPRNASAKHSHSTRTSLRLRQISAICCWTSIVHPKRSHTSRRLSKRIVPTASFVTCSSVRRRELL